jgi:cobalt/nickel transport system ATP-binding protein
VLSAPEARQPPVFEAADLRYSYLGRFVALDGVSLSVRRGEAVALLGANGCGKSTLLKVLDGLLFPDAGTLEAFGQPVTEDHLEDDQFAQAFRSRVGFVFQSSDSQVFSPTVREELAFGPLQMRLPSEVVEQRVDDTLALLELDTLADRAPHQLSGGEKKRVALGSVLVMDPDVLLFDEPTAALDPRTQQWMVELIEELREAGKTVVLATHDLDALPTMADRCLVLSEEHRIVGEGTPDEVLADAQLLLDVNLVHAGRARSSRGALDHRVAARSTSTG